MAVKTERSIVVVRSQAEIMSFLNKVMNEKTDVMFENGCDGQVGHICDLQEGLFSVDVPVKGAEAAPVREAMPRIVTLTIERDRYFYSFECRPRESGEQDGTDTARRVFSLPDEMRRVRERDQRVAPTYEAVLMIPEFSVSSLKEEAESFYPWPETKRLLNNLDELLFLADEYSLLDARRLCEKELGKISDRAASSGFCFVHASEDTNGLIDRAADLWIPDTQKPPLSGTQMRDYCRRGIGSIVIRVISNQFKKRRGYLILTRPMNKHPLVQREADLVKALARRMCLVAGGNRQVSFKVRDISEEGLSFPDRDKELALLDRGAILKDVVLALTAKTNMSLNAVLVRHDDEGCGLRLQFPDSRQQEVLSEYVEHSLELHG